MAKEEKWVWTTLAHDVYPKRKVGQEIEWRGKVGRKNVPDSNFKVWQEQRWVRLEESSSTEKKKSIKTKKDFAQSVVDFIQEQHEVQEIEHELPSKPREQAEPEADNKEPEGLGQIQQANAPSVKTIKGREKQECYQGGIDPIFLIEHMDMHYSIAKIVIHATDRDGRYIDNLKSIAECLQREQIQADAYSTYHPFSVAEHNEVYEFIDSWQGITPYNMLKLLDILLNSSSCNEYRANIEKAGAVINMELRRFDKTYSRIVSKLGKEEVKSWQRPSLIKITET